jgi:hypothetical protein
LPSDLARDLRYAMNPVLFAAERLGLDLDPWAARLVRDRGQRELVNVTRQGGKSTSTAAGALHEGAYVERSKTVVISPSQRQSSLLLASVQEMAERAKVRIRPHPGEDPGLLLPRGEFIALPGAEATTRGLARCTWLIVDEAARVPDALYYSAQAYLATTNGRIWLLSTPFGKRGFFYVEHEAGRFRVTRVPATMCPRVSAGFLADQHASLPDAWFRQEYCCEFTSVENAMFDHDLVLRSVDAGLEPLIIPPLEPLL